MRYDCILVFWPLNKKTPLNQDYFNTVISFYQIYRSSTFQDSWLQKLFFKNIYLCIWLCRVLVAACRIFSCSLWDLVPWPGIKPRAPAVGARSLSHWTTREAPRSFVFKEEHLYIFHSWNICYAIIHFNTIISPRKYLNLSYYILYLYLTYNTK